ncbi:hypothetical protein MMC14_003995 [Varicellaria rhodocarpa]|nr:hypothetical protein [Varicellaria rhodocarpa]
MSAADEVDSRNSAIQRKARGNESEHHEEIFAPQGTTTLNRSTMSGVEETGIVSGVKVGASTESTVGNQPSVNWNVGTTAKIRTSLGAARSENRAGLQASKAVSITVPLQLIKDSTSFQTADRLEYESESPKIQAPSQSDTQTIIPESRDQVPILQKQPLLTNLNSPQLSAEGADSDGGIALNLASEEQSDESGEVHESDDLGLDGQQDMEMKLGNAAIPDDEQRDATMDYSKARSTPISFKAVDMSGPHEHQPHVLADLEPDDLELHFRYFYMGQDPQTIELNEPIRCLICRGAHTAATCATNPDQYKRGGAGRPIAGAECDLCHEYHSGSCEMLWRTSGLYRSVQNHNIQIHLSCYECGGKGHLGNDCPVRRPRKIMGSSTWTIKNEQASQGISIRGRADQKKPIVIDDSEDDQANFHRPRIPPAQRPQIQVPHARVKSKPVDSRTWADMTRRPPEPRSSWVERNSHLQTPFEPPPLRDSRLFRDAPGSPEVSRGARRRRSRSRSPPGPSSYNIRDRAPHSRVYDGAADDYEPYPEASLEQAGGSKLAKRRAHRKKNKKEANTYRPMPSAAQNAWKKHRT